jgi:hypothetical protein
MAHYRKNLSFRESQKNGERGREYAHKKKIQVNNPTLELHVARRSSFKGTVDQWRIRDMILRKLIEMEPKEREAEEIGGVFPQTFCRVNIRPLELLDILRSFFKGTVGRWFVRDMIRTKRWCIIEGHFVIEKAPKERRTAIRTNDGQSIHLNIFQVNNAPLKLLAARRSSFKGTVNQWRIRDMILRKFIEMEPKERRMGSRRNW